MPATELTFGVTLAVLGAGFLHALWNAMLKSAAGDPMLDTALIVAGSSVVALFLLPFVGVPAVGREFMACRRSSTSATTSRSRPRIAWRLSFAYPLMRARAVIVTMLGVLFLGEHPVRRAHPHRADLDRHHRHRVVRGRSPTRPRRMALRTPDHRVLHAGLAPGARERDAAGYVSWLIFLEGLRTSRSSSCAADRRGAYVARAFGAASPAAREPRRLRHRAVGMTHAPVAAVPVA